MSLELPRIYPITDTTVSPLTHAEQLKLLIEGGAKFVQLREKTASPREFYLAARESLAIAGERNVRIIINDRVDIAFALKADGVHLGQQDLLPRFARKLLGNDMIIGYSTHSVEQAIEAVKMPIDYVAIGPVYDTQTKKNPADAVGIEGVKRVRDAIGDFPLVAIGGINLENAADVFRAGADSIAVVSALISDAGKIVGKMKQFNEL